MKGLKRIIIMPRAKKTVTINDVLSYNESVNKTIDFVDGLTEIKNACDRVVLKNLRIKKYLHKKNEDFEEDFLNQLSDGDGMSFLICKN